MTGIVLLDGGMGQELIHRAGDKPTPLWSTQVMFDHPGLVAEVHAEYAAAGATLHTTNTYAILRDRLADTPLEDQFAALHAAALKEASQVDKKAGALGPLGASYRPDLLPPQDEAVAAYTEVAQALAPGVDLLLAETVVSVAHARAVLAAMETTGKPCWLACSVMDTDGTRLRSGEPLAEVFAVAEAADAILVNCAVPEAIDDAIDVLAMQDKPFGAYANGFTRISEGFLGAKPTVDALTRRTDLGPEAYARFAMGWIAKGATIVGGCCEVGPAHIAKIASEIRAAGHQIVAP